MNPSTMIRSTIVLALLISVVSALADTPAIHVDLRRIGHIAPKGRVQDRAYNPKIPEVDALIHAGTAAIPFLISKLEDSTIIETPVMDFWRKCAVGDVAWFILCDFLRTPEGASTIEPAFESLIEPDNRGAYAAWQTALQQYGRKGIRERIEAILKPYEAKLIWDPNGLCFRPAK